MLVNLRLRQLLLRVGLMSLMVFMSLPVHARTYIAVAPAQLKIKTDSGSTKPKVMDYRLGYDMGVHKLELAYMKSQSDDNLNELVTDIPSVTSLFYRYDPDPGSGIKMEFILGYSQVEIESTYINVPTFTETFSGLSYGIGIEEALQSLPQMKFKIDFIRMYKGDTLKLDLLSVGFRYEF